MTLSDTGQARVNGYLYVLDRALRAALPAAAAREARREVESHLRERVEQAVAFPDELTTVREILRALGPPHQTAQAYAAEFVVDAAVRTPHLRETCRAVVHLGLTTVSGFVAANLVLMGYMMAFGGLALSVAKLVFPQHTGFWFREGTTGPFIRLALDFTPPAGQSPAGGYWVVPLGLAIAAGVYVATTAASRAFLRWFRARRRRPMWVDSESPEAMRS